MRIKTDTFRENSTSLIDEIVAPFNEARVPFSSTQGASRPQKATPFMHLEALTFDSCCRTMIIKPTSLTLKKSFVNSKSLP